MTSTKKPSTSIGPARGLNSLIQFVNNLSPAYNNKAALFSSRR